MKTVAATDATGVGIASTRRASSTLHHVVGTASAGPVEDAGQIGEDASQASHVAGHCSIVRPAATTATTTTTTTTAPKGSPGYEGCVGPAVALLEHPPLARSTVGSPIDRQGGPVRTQLLLSTCRDAAG